MQQRPEQQRRLGGRRSCSLLNGNFVVDGPYAWLGFGDLLLGFRPCSVLVVRPDPFFETTVIFASLVSRSAASFC